VRSKRRKGEEIKDEVQSASEGTGAQRRLPRRVDRQDSDTQVDSWFLNSFAANSWGQVFYQIHNSWGQDTIHGDRFSIVIRRSIALSAFIRSAPPSQLHVVKLFRQGSVSRERIDPLAFHLPRRTFAVRLHALSRSRRHGREFSKDSQHSLPATLYPGRSLRPGGAPITSFLRSRKTQSPPHSASRIGRAPVVRFGPNRSR